MVGVKKTQKEASWMKCPGFHTKRHFSITILIPI
jgi:hypothetical protein